MKIDDFLKTMVRGIEAVRGVVMKGSQGKGLGILGFVGAVCVFVPGSLFAQTNSDLEQVSENRVIGEVEQSQELFEGMMSETFPDEGGYIEIDGANEGKYCAVSVGSSVGYACSMSQEWIPVCRVVASSNSDFQKDQFREKVKADKGLKLEIARAQKILSTKTFRMRPERRYSVSYANKGFFVIVGSTEEVNPNRWSKLQKADAFGNYTSGVSFGLVKSVRWTSAAFGMGAIATIQLKGLAADIKGRIEAEFGQNIVFRWTWKGLATGVTETSLPMFGMVSKDTWCVPKNRLRAELVDRDGTVIWTQ